MTSYFTFGQQHEHSFGDEVLDRDCVVVITADDPRKVMLERFGVAWSMEYSDPPDRKMFPGRWVRIKE
jgi:hypothetical protein